MIVFVRIVFFLWWIAILFYDLLFYVEWACN